LLALGLGCQLLVDLEDLQDGNCGADQKLCENRCVSRYDPRTGCALSSCAPCILPNATARCGDNGQCAIATCIGNYANCDDAEDQPGCETDLAHDPNHCGSCTARPCVTANGIAGCSARRCATGGCNPGWEDCNHQPEDGCEVDVRTASDCGACERACAPGQACRQIDAGAAFTDRVCE
jgi:hypothetical protein